jgi:hypothetical protein
MTSRMFADAAIVPGLDTWVAGLFDDEHLDNTCETVTTVSNLEPEHDKGRELDLRRQLKECDAKLARYRQLLEHDADITVVATWIAEVERERRRLKRELGRKPTARKLTKAEIKALVRQLKDVVAVLANADPIDKRAIYDELGVNLTYHPDGRVHVGAGARVLGVRVGGGTCRSAPRDFADADGLAGVVRATMMCDVAGPVVTDVVRDHDSRNANALATNSSWYWKMPPCPASG